MLVSVVKFQPRRVYRSTQAVHWCAIKPTPQKQNSARDLFFRSPRTKADPLELKSLQSTKYCPSYSHVCLCGYNDCALTPHHVHPCVLAVCVVCHTCLTNGLFCNTTSSVMFLFYADCLLSPVGFHVLHDSSMDATVLEQGGQFRNLTASNRGPDQSQIY